MERWRPIIDVIGNKEFLALTLAAQFLLKRVRQELMLQKHINELRNRTQAKESFNETPGNKSSCLSPLCILLQEIRFLFFCSALEEIT
jgi:hypothetical protein